ncbi:MAG: hypothetical protein QM773_12510 [Hyphomonadaceae bacterium]
MLHASTQQLIRKLCELTEDGAIAWQEGADGRSTFETEGYIVEIAGEPPAVRLLRLDGRELEHADASDLALAWPSGEGTYSTRVAEMARNASRHARGAETAIARILSSLSAPPKKAPEPEPEPAALAFADIPHPGTERVAALAVVNADLDARKPAEDPPVSHSLPEPAPHIEISSETETAIDRVLAVQPAPQPALVIVEAEPSPPVVEAAAPEPEPEPEIEPASRTPPILIEEQDPVLAAPEPEPEPIIIAAPEPEPKPIVAEASQSEPPPAPRLEPLAAAAKPGFGSTSSFARAPQLPTPSAPAPQSEATKVTSTGLLMRGFSARTLQTVEPAMAKDIFRPAPKPAPAPEKELEPSATGADIYKPWA